VAQFTETVMTYPHKQAGPPILLMQYKNTAPPKNQLGKLVFYVEDVRAMREKLVNYGCEVFLELGEGEGWVSKIFMCRDPDGFVLEFMPLSMLKGVPDSKGKL
jgi:predicted enzyme related to lactoylglutathione lyase